MPFLNIKITPLIGNPLTGVVVFNLYMQIHITVLMYMYMKRNNSKTNVAQKVMAMNKLH